MFIANDSFTFYGQELFQRIILFKHGQTNFEMFPETGSSHTPFLSCFVLISKIYLQSGFKLEPISYASQ